MFVKSPNFMVVVCVEVKWFTVFCFHVFPRFRKGFYLSHCVSCGVLLAWQFAELHLILWCKVPFKISSTIWLICVVSFFLFKNQNTHNVQIFCRIFSGLCISRRKRKVVLRSISLVLDFYGMRYGVYFKKF